MDVQYPFEERPQRTHDRILNISSFYLDKYPVTQADYSLYLLKTGYKPNSDPRSGNNYHNWLKNWDWSAASDSTPAPKQTAAQFWFQFFSSLLTAKDVFKVKNEARKC